MDERTANAKIQPRTHSHICPISYWRGWMEGKALRETLSYILWTTSLADWRTPTVTNPS